MRSRPIKGLAAAVLPLLAWSCTTTPTPPYPDAASFCVAKAKAICQASAICAADVTACETHQVTACDAEAAAATASGVRKYSTDNAPGCIDALNAAFGGNASQVPFAQLVGPGTLTDKCDRVFVGNAGTNQSCASDDDCTNKLICAPAQPGAVATSFVCAAPVPKNATDFCAEPGAECPMDTYCAQPPTGGAVECIPSAQPGQACTATAPCVSAQRCSNGLCVDRATGGAPCSTNDDCAAIDPYCDVYAGSICTIGLTFATGALDCKGFLLGMITSPAGDDAGNDATGGD
jgi:hypothetical protein